ncbi:hypothetical protein [Rhodoferax saidenbachensis]|uniref:Rap1a immunity protein domain-containing protein n=1 Tax=Rhodoferax saidenbachensis TaxID=1484693 RepID=A0ABU1ZJG3_9BURK|nr:hypothetical protein [Rhodoferax saidenbachensis]MDR7305690.1 hypothetical protein [Rhodoferax saidenbachensis]
MHIHSPRTSLQRAATVLALLAAGMVTANAMTIREMRALEKTEKQGATYTDYYLVGVMEGAIEAHTQDVRNGAKPSICLNGRRLEPSMAKNLYTTELKRNADLYEADMPVQLVLTNALTTVYPC